MGQYPLVQLMITVSAPEHIGGNEGRSELAAFYGDLLGMHIVSEGWLEIAKRDFAAVPSQAGTTN